MDNETKQTMEKKAYFYKDNEIPVHVTKKNGWFHNGIIIDVKYDFFIIVDEKDGAMPIFFLEVVEIEKRELKEDVKETRTTKTKSN